MSVRFDKDPEHEKIIEILYKDFEWDLSRLTDDDRQSLAEPLVHYTIKAVKKLLINTPHAEVFDSSVKGEMAHHLQRWKDESGTPPHHFQMVLSMINGKLAKAIWEFDEEKFEHHLITLAAVSGTTHKYLKTENSEVNKWFKNKKAKLKSDDENRKAEAPSPGD